MKKTIKTLMIASISLLGLVSCNKDFDDLNKDPKHPTELPSKNLLASSLTSSITDIYTPNVNGNNFRFFVQYITETTYTDESNYDLETRSQPKNFFTAIYTKGINRIKLAKESLEKEVNSEVVKKNKLATLEIQEIFLWETLVDTFGNIPYSETFSETQTPKYDDAFEIYKDLISRLDKAVLIIDDTEKGFQEGDFIYSGDMNKWKKLANSIKLRLGVNLADVDAIFSKKTVEDAVKSGVISSDSESYSMEFDGGTYSNPVYDDFIATGRADFVPTKNLVDLMNEKQDPRREVWFTKVADSYKGGIIGDKNTYADFSHYKDVLTSATAPVKLLSVVEVQFLLAESAARGYSVGGSAKDFYEKAVGFSMQEYGIKDRTKDYLDKNPYDANNWKKSIGEQVWVSLFDRAFAAWNFSRRLDFPKLVEPTKNKLKVVSPSRMPYSHEEYQLNGTNVKAAAKVMGGDTAETKLFWDKN